MKKVFGLNYWTGMLAGLMVAGGLLAGCDPEEPCLPSPGVYRVGFFALDANGVKEARAYNFDEVQAIGSDSSFFLRNQTGVTTLRLALNPGSDTTTFMFRYENSADTLSLKYTRLFNVVSPECGLGVSFSDLQVVAHTFDSVNILTTEVSAYTANEIGVEVISLDQCINQTTNLFETGFFVSNEEGSRQARNFNFDTVQAVGRSRIFYRYTEAGIRSLRMSLDPASDSSSFLFKYGGRADTLTLGYERFNYIGLPECGLDTLFRNLRVLKNPFDSIRIVNTALTTNNTGFDIEIINTAACESDATNAFEAGFFTLSETGVPEPRTLNFDEVRAVESGEVFFTRNAEGTVQLPLALAPEVGQTTFVFDNQAGADTLVISYEKEARLFSPECNEDEFFTKLTITSHTFDSVGLRTQLLKTQEGLAVEIYP